jgi:hypothetical protein
MVYTSSEACIYIKGNMEWYIWYKRKSPKNQLERATNPKFPPQAHKCSLVERLCKDVCKLILGRDMTQHKWSLSPHCLSRNDTSLLCVWFWNEALGFLLRLWHWCYHKEVRSGCTPHQSLLKCMRSTKAGNNNSRLQHTPPWWWTKLH